MSNDDVLMGYIARTQPVQWVGWEAKVPDEPTRIKLRSILFDRDERLRDLTTPTIRIKVTECVKDNPTLRKVVLSEAESLIGTVAAKSTTDHGKKKGGAR